MSITHDDGDDFYFSWHLLLYIFLFHLAFPCMWACGIFSWLALSRFSHIEIRTGICEFQGSINTQPIAYIILHVDRSIEREISESLPQHVQSCVFMLFTLLELYVWVIFANYTVDFPSKENTMLGLVVCSWPAKSGFLVSTHMWFL